MTKLKKSFLKNALSIFIITAFVVFSTLIAVRAETAFSPKPLFEVAIGENSPEKLGKNINEEDIKNYDRFYFPASFGAFESEGLIMVLDSYKERICKYDLSGKFAGAIKLPFKKHAIDFAWFPGTKTAFFVFQESVEIGLLKGDISKNDKFDSFKLFNTPALAGGLVPADFSIQRIWPASSLNTVENTFIINTNSHSIKNMAFGFKADEMKKLAELPGEFSTPAAFQGKSAAVDVDVRDSEAVMISQELTSDESDWVILLNELAPKIGKGVKNIRVVGTDVKNNVYIEALYGNAEDAITAAFVYKFTKNGRFSGRVQVPKSPEMLSNRFVYIDAGGSVFYMKKSGDMKKIQFFRFEITEMN